MNQRLQDTVAALEEAGIEFSVVDLGGPARRTKDVIQARGLDVDPEAIVKTIMFKGSSLGTFSVSVRGKDRVSYAKLRAVLNDKRISTLHPDEMRAIGWEPGECCPLSIPGPLYVDPTVMDFDRINTGSGDLRYGLEYPPDAVQALRDDVSIVDVREE